MIHKANLQFFSLLCTDAFPFFLRTSSLLYFLYSFFSRFLCCFTHLSLHRPNSILFIHISLLEQQIIPRKSLGQSDFYFERNVYFSNDALNDQK